MEYDHAGEQCANAEGNDADQDVQSIDRNGIHVKWENGAEHPVNPEFDRFLPFDLAAYAASEAEEDVADW